MEYQTLNFAGQPALTIPRMSVIYEAHPIHQALLLGNLNDPEMWHWIEHYVGVAPQAICLNIESHDTMPLPEMTTERRERAYYVLEELVRKIKERYPGVPVSSYFYPPTVHHWHLGPLDQYAQGVRQAALFFKALDFYCPCAYALPDIKQWRKLTRAAVSRLESEITLLADWRALGVKPIYPFLSPVFEANGAPSDSFGKSIGRTRLKQMAAWCRSNCDGFVLWGGTCADRPWTDYSWVVEAFKQ